LVKSEQTFQFLGSYTLVVAPMGGEIWHEACQIHPPSVQHVAPAGTKNLKIGLWVN